MKTVQVISKVFKKARNYVLYQESELFRTEEEVYTTHVLQMLNCTPPSELNMEELVKKDCHHGSTCATCYIGGLERIIEIDKLRDQYMLLCHYSRRQK